MKKILIVVVIVAAMVMMSGIATAAESYDEDGVPLQQHTPKKKAGKHKKASKRKGSKKAKASPLSQEKKPVVSDDDPVEPIPKFQRDEEEAKSTEPYPQDINTILAIMYGGLPFSDAAYKGKAFGNVFAGGGTWSNFGKKTGNIFWVKPEVMWVVNPGVKQLSACAAGAFADGSQVSGVDDQYHYSYSRIAAGGVLKCVNNNFYGELYASIGNSPMSGELGTYKNNQTENFSKVNALGVYWGSNMFITEVAVSGYFPFNQSQSQSVNGAAIPSQIWDNRVIQGTWGQSILYNDWLLGASIGAMHEYGSGRDMFLIGAKAKRKFHEGKGEFIVDFQHQSISDLSSLGLGIGYNF